MKLSRRNLIVAAIGVPAVAASGWSLRGQAGIPAAVYGEDLLAGRTFARALGAAGLPTLAVAGDPLTAARDVLRQRPPRLAGVTTDADAQAFASAGVEQGYEMAFLLRGNDHGCSGFTDNPAWNPSIRMAVGAGKEWLGTFAGFVKKPDEPLLAGGTGFHNGTLVSAWLLLPSPGTSPRTA
ncbi:hypothetical protein [Aurantiacibacter zhengii]|uniref:Uncharacterized protein n=1 Tax=Aurantiacibacter zhengii TaxID=2307003 RepID=A0A418NS83_9SPHN|nr:hypothetical protein [Aurantiacibacter zhengii]RIV85918.1 hypothetical protein D2V07_11480 [Aurantiacibacter zhengii]